MDVKDIRYFIAIAESGSMSQAARDLFVSQPALSRAISNLEKEIWLSKSLKVNSTPSCSFEKAMY